MSAHSRFDKRSNRLLKILANKKVRVRQSHKSNSVVLAIEGERSISCETALIASWLRSGYVELIGKRAGSGCSSIRLTEVGASFLKRMSSGDFADQHRELENQTVKVDDLLQAVRRNTAESPLSSLFRQSQGKKSWLSSIEFDAGERLRSDFEFSQLIPRTTSSWDPTSNVGHSNGGRSLEESLSDRVLSARQRLHQALSAVGPEFSSVLLDICCFLKGLEQVEREKQWPRRSAKLLLRSALSALARHYNPTVGGIDEPNILHWAKADYRPKMNSN